MASSYGKDIHGLEEELRDLRPKPLVPRAVSVDILPGWRNVKVAWGRVLSECKSLVHPSMVSSVFLNSVPTLDDETEAEASEGQVSKHRLFLRLAHNVILCVAAVQLEGQRELSGLNVLFDLREQHDKIKLRVTNKLTFLLKAIPVAAKWLPRNWSTKRLTVFSLNFASCL